jgi:hypothetical protein
MRGKPKENQAVVLKHVRNPIVMHIEKIDTGGKKCTCVWQDKMGAPFRTEFNTEILESYKAKGWAEVEAEDRPKPAAFGKTG